MLDEEGFWPRELAGKAACAGRNLVSTMRKLFDVLAEGLISKNSRDDRTAIELFLAGVQGWEESLRRSIDDGKATPV